MIVVKNRKIFYTISIILLILSIGALSIWGLNLSIDFKGGSILEIKYEENRPELSVLNEALKPLNIASLSVREAGVDSFIIRSVSISEQDRQAVIKTAAINGLKIEEKRFSNIGPLLGKEAMIKSLWAIFMVLIAIVLFMAFAFRKVSLPISSWKYGLIAVVGLAHDIIIPIGVFAALGNFAGVEIDALFVTAILVVLGYSIHDKIVVFDRVRENLKLEYGRKGSSFEEIVGKSINQTFVRSVNTSLTTLLALFILYFIGPVATQFFSLVLIIGIAIGTYSSIFIASNLLVTVEGWNKNRFLKR